MTENRGGYRGGQDLRTPWRIQRVRGFRFPKMDKISPDWQGCTQIFKTASDIAYTPIFKLRLHLQHFRVIYTLRYLSSSLKSVYVPLWNYTYWPFRLFLWKTRNVIFIRGYKSYLCCVHLNLLRFQWIFCYSRKVGGGGPPSSNLLTNIELRQRTKPFLAAPLYILSSCTPIYPF